MTSQRCRTQNYLLYSLKFFQLFTASDDQSNLKKKKATSSISKCLPITQVNSPKQPRANTLISFKQNRRKFTALHAQCSIASVYLPHEDTKHTLSCKKDLQSTARVILLSFMPHLKNKLNRDSNNEFSLFLTDKTAPTTKPVMSLIIK